MSYYGEQGEGCQVPYNFQLLRLPWEARAIGAVVARYEGLLPPGAWPNWVLGNHDNHRIASRVGPAQARVAAMLLLTLRGTPTLYYGDELGMLDVAIPPALAQDPWEKNVPGLGLGRDPERTPMQWDAGPSAGFTTGTPWLPAHPEYTRLSVEAQRADPDSMLSLHRRLIALRRREPALAIGAWSTVAAEGALLAYARGSGARRLLIVLNLGPEPALFITEQVPICGVVVACTTLAREGERVEGSLALAGDEGLVVALEGGSSRTG